MAKKKKIDSPLLFFRLLPQLSVIVAFNPLFSKIIRTSFFPDILFALFHAQSPWTILRLRSVSPSSSSCSRCKSIVRNPDDSQSDHPAQGRGRGVVSSRKTSSTLHLLCILSILSRLNRSSSEGSSTQGVVSNLTFVARESCKRDMRLDDCSYSYNYIITETYNAFLRVSRPRTGGNLSCAGSFGSIADETGTRLDPWDTPLFVKDPFFWRRYTSGDCECQNDHDLWFEIRIPCNFDPAGIWIHRKLVRGNSQSPRL